MKKPQTIYIIEVTHRGTGDYAISQEAYFDIQDAINFIDGRADGKIRWVAPFTARGEQYCYHIEVLSCRWQLRNLRP